MKNTTAIKRLFSFVLALLMVFSMLPQITMGASAADMSGGEELYLKPNSNWTQNSARFAIYVYGSSGNAWASMTDSDGDGIYEVTVPTGSWTNVIFCRMTPSNTTNDWSNKWNQTGNLVYDGTKNLCTINDGQWDCGENVTWSVYAYTVAGDAGLCGTAWDVSNTANDMTESSGVYTKVYESVAAGTYEFKVVLNHSWDVSYPSSNYALTVGKDGSTVTITFNGSSKTVSASVEAPADIPAFTDTIKVVAIGCESQVTYIASNSSKCTVGEPYEQDGEYLCDIKVDLTGAEEYYRNCFDESHTGYTHSDPQPAIPNEVITVTAKYIDEKWTATTKSGAYYPDHYYVFTCTEAEEDSTTDYQVGFATGCDADVASQTVEANGTVIKPTDPTREGYTFGGWYTEDTFQNEYDFTTQVTSDLTLYARWVENTSDSDEETDTITVYFRNDWVWPEVYIHYWNEADATVGSTWPGMLMTFVEEDATTGYDIYSAEIPSGLSGILFNGIENGKTGEDNRQQTPDVTDFSDGDAFYIHWDDGNKCSKFEYTPAGDGEDDEEGGETAEDVSYSATFHFANTLNWSTVNLYTWVGSSALTGSWPGTATSLKNGYYTATVDFTAAAGQGLNFIFNDGSAQTVDLALTASDFKLDGETYKAEKWVVLTTQTDGKYNAAIVDSAEAIVTSPVVDGSSVTFNYGDSSAQTVAVAGSFNDWTPVAMTKDDNGIWTVTVNELEAGDYQYKFVVDGNWILDPMNGNVVTETDGNQNSAFYILSDASVDDNNTVTINIHYERTGGDYENWNLWVWGNALDGQQVDFTTTDSDGAQVATIVLENAREHQSISFKERKSVEGNDWADQGDNCTIDLSTVVSGTIDYYIPSDKCVYGEDVIRKNKISSVALDYDNGVIIVTSVQAIANADSALSLYKGEEEITVTITAVGSQYTLTLPENTELELSELYQYQVDYYGDKYSIAIDAAYASNKFAEEYTYDGDDLGAAYTSASTTFKVWAPTAKAVSVNLYTSGTQGTDDLIKSVSMTADVNGTWVATEDGDLNGTYYTYLVTVDGDTVEAVDPYARTTGVNGQRGMVIDLDSTDPDGWENDKNPNPVSSQTDAIIYELHVRDFSNHESSGMTNKGKYLAFTEKGTTVNSAGQTSTGIDYLADLGITHLHLLPVYDYGSVDETTCSNFNWGYDPVNYNVPEGSYSTDPYNGATRVSEFKQMVKSLHDHDISVVMDVVYNHVYNAEKFCFNNIVPGYFSRTDSNTSGCGNDTASEREMVRKYIVESVLYWHQEYHIDGFRFDLVGLLDVETINQIVEEVHACCPDVIFYGEGWNMDSTNKESGTQMAKQGNAYLTPGFAYFSDSMRNGIAGSNGSSLGFASGAGNGGAMANEWMAMATSGDSVWTSNPQQVVQYASCHDNYTLADKLVLSAGASGVTDNIVKMNNLAAAFYMTAQGISFIHAGEEFLREKLEEGGSRCENSYNASDAVNNIDWTALSEYADNISYYKGLIDFRQAHPALRLSSADAVEANVYNQTAEGNLLVYWIDGREVTGESYDNIYVIFNANSTAVDVTLPSGDWEMHINGTQAGTKAIKTVSGTVSVAGISAMVLVQEAGIEEPKQTKSNVALPGSFNSWNQANYMDLTDDANVVTQTLSLPAGTYEFKIKNGDAWLSNSGTITDSTTGSASDGWDMTESVSGNCKLQASGGAYTFKFNLSTSKLIVEYDPNGGDLGDPAEYYLCGYINGADYAMGFETSDYKFTDGKLTTTFTADSYVVVKNGDSSEKYMTKGYLGAVTSATMHQVSDWTATGYDKLLIPGGDEVTITMVKNDDNTITLSYETTSSTAFVDKSGVQEGVTLHCWNWSFDNITANMATIAAQGYTAIQTSPIQVMKEATNGTDNTVGSHWWVYYQPVDFVITTDSGNALGTKTDFKEMCAEAEKYGIKVIVDVVANHLGNETGNDLSSKIPAEIRENTNYWHDITTNITDWNDRENMTQYCLSGLPDLNTANEDIQNYVLKFLKECVDAGADGFRFDMAKSIETPKDDASFASDFWPTVVGGIREYAENDLYIYGEVLDDPKIAISAYTEYMSVTDNGWGNNMRTRVASGTAALAEGFYKSADASNLVIWAESHDTFADGSSSDVSEENINKTWALVAARADAMGLYLARPLSMDQVLGVASVTGWANAEVKAVNQFHNTFAGQSETIGNSGSFSYVVRGDSGIVIVNTTGTTAEVALTVDMADGTYFERITGNEFTVADGELTGTIGATGIAVVMGGEAKIGETVYANLSEAIENAETGNTIVLHTSASLNQLMLTKGVTLDLNGNDLTATCACAFEGNSIIDSVGGGLLKVPKDMLGFGQAEQEYLPIWDNQKGGYVFAACGDFKKMEEKLTENSVKYIFLPYLDASYYELIAQGQEVSDVTLKVDVTWTSANGLAGNATFSYSDALMQQFYKAYDPATGKFGHAFTLKLSGTASVQDLAFKVYFASETGAKLYCVAAE